MKKKFWGFMLLLTILFFSCLFYVKAEDNVNATNVDNIEAEKGDLRCNPKYLNNGCQEIRDPNTNKVVEIRITTKFGNNYITKIAKKTDVPGKIKIHFESNIVSHVSSYKDKDIVVLVDYSGSFKNSQKAALKAVTAFGKRVKDEYLPYYRVAYARFSELTVGSYTKVLKGWSNDPTAPTSWGGYAEHAHSAIQIGLRMVYDNLLKAGKHRAGVDTILIVVSDGGFWPYGSYAMRVKKTTNYVTINYPNCSSKTYQKKQKHTTGNTMESEAKNIRDNGTIIFGIRYPGYYTSGNEKCRSVEDMYTIIGERKRLVELANNSNENDWNKAFDQILNDISQSVGSNTSVIITDKLGDAFKENGNGEKIVEIKNGTSEEFEVNMDTSVDNGWYPTNNGFSAKYQEDGVDKVISSPRDNNPEVYWIKNTNIIPSCNGIASFDNEIYYKTDYYYVVCNEGYKDGAGRYYNGYSANVIINNLNPKETHFDASLGFTGEIKLSTNIRCSYVFNKDKFNKDYSNLQNQFNRTGDEKEKASIQLKINDLSNTLDKYISLLSRLKDYNEIFKKQTAIIGVYYPNSADNNTANFIDKGDTNTNVFCSNISTANILGKNIEINQTCYMNGSKSMQLPKSCVDVYSYSQVGCSGDTILDGGNFYYPKNTTEGDIKVNINNAGFSGDVEIILNDCTFNKGYSKPIYRNIDIDDPFIQDYSARERNIGNNWLNSITDSPKYDFTGIIKSDIWSQEYEYKYSLGEKNVDNIQKDTSDDSDKVNSYQGNDCYINDQKKYICEFVREGCDNTIEEEVEFFQYCDIK